MSKNNKQLSKIVNTIKDIYGVKNNSYTIYQEKKIRKTVASLCEFIKKNHNINYEDENNIRMIVSLLNI